MPNTIAMSIKSTMVMTAILLALSAFFIALREEALLVDLGEDTEFPECVADAAVCPADCPVETVFFTEFPFKEECGVEAMGEEETALLGVAAGSGNSILHQGHSLLWMGYTCFGLTEHVFSLEFGSGDP